MEGKKPECSKCQIKDKICCSPDGQAPPFCPTVNRKDVTARANQEYAKKENHEFARQASIQESECYANREKTPYVLHPVKPRVQEVAEFSQKMGYKRLGVAFCAGLAREALALTRILEAQDFEVVSACCKAGCTPKETLGIKENEKVFIGRYESMCSPIGQAMLMNEEKTDFNVLVGLCVGHDSLFLKYAQAPCTVLVVKDRVLGHNSAAALYTSSTYYARLLRKDF
jgi:uncharacterized metal-binding protein